MLLGESEIVIERFPVQTLFLSHFSGPQCEVEFGTTPVEIDLDSAGQKRNGVKLLVE